MMKFALFMTLAAIALAAPDASPLEHGTCGGAVGAQCPPGYFCHYSRPGTLGVCRRGAIPPTISPKARAMEFHTCGGVVGAQCPPGYFCHYSRPGSLGVCRHGVIPPDAGSEASAEISSKPRPMDLHTCGGFANDQCPSGQYCDYSSGHGSLGVCRREVGCGGFANVGCPEGHFCHRERGTGGVCHKASVCGGIASLRCPQGFQCVSNASHPDASGYCFPA